MYIIEQNPTEDPRIQKTFGSNPKGQIERSNKQKYRQWKTLSKTISKTT